MMTIRHVGGDKKEQILSVASINYDPATNEVIGFLSLDGERGDVVKLNSGTAFIMNDRGQTVAIYSLKK